MNKINTIELLKSHQITCVMIEKELRVHEAKNVKRNIAMLDKVKEHHRLSDFDPVPADFFGKQLEYLPWRNKMAEQLIGNKYNNNSALNAIRMAALSYIEVEDRLEQYKLSNVLRTAQEKSGLPVLEFIKKVHEETGKDITYWLYKKEVGLLAFNSRSDIEKVFKYLNISLDVNGYINLNMKMVLEQTRKSAPARYGVTAHKLAFPWHSERIKNNAQLIESLNPDPSAPDNVRLEIRGDFNRLVSFCGHGNDDAHKRKHLTSMEEIRCQLSVVAGARFELTAFRL
jgi:hypothetical protein